ncbi:hypothetical protein [Microvirga antarctica]|nr:hypothetical protein [Microvirga antarctica]
MPRSRSSRARAWSPISVVVALTAGSIGLAGVVHLIARLLQP